MDGDTIDGSLPVRPLAALLPLCLLAACAGSTGDEQVRRFVAQTTNDGTGKPRYLRKWEAPVRVAVSGVHAERLAGDVARHLDHLRAVTGHDVALAASETEANLWVLSVRSLDRDPWLGHPHIVGWFFRGDNQAAEVSRRRAASARNAVCYVLINNDRPAVERALAVIPANIGAADSAHCVVEEITHTFGLYDHTVEGSAINADDDHDGLTAQDDAFLRALYDPRLRSGMTAAEVVPLAGQILR